MIIILRGISGSGKSTLAKILSANDTVEDDGVDKLINKDGLNSEAAKYLWRIYDDSPAPRNVFSVDDYFTKGKDYMFDPRKLSIAHGSCLRKFADAIRQPMDNQNDQTLIVDNTNCSLTEVSPYASLALAYSHELHIVTLFSDPRTCYPRATHNVPLSTIIRQDMNLRKSITEWPPWFPQYVVSTD